MFELGLGAGLKRLGGCPANIFPRRNVRDNGATRRNEAARTQNHTLNHATAGSKVTAVSKEDIP